MKIIFIVIHVKCLNTLHQSTSTFSWLFVFWKNSAKNNTTHFRSFHKNAVVYITKVTNLDIALFIMVPTCIFEMFIIKLIRHNFYDWRNQKTRQIFFLYSKAVLKRVLVPDWATWSLNNWQVLIRKFQTRARKTQ